MISFKRLKDLREDDDKNQREMAEILGVKRSTYSLWEIGINIIPLENLCDFADYFEVTIDYVLNLNNDKEVKIIKGLDLNKLGNNMKTIRVNNKLSQEYIAKVLNVSQACIAKYENAQITISVSNLYKFSKKFNVSLSDLCDKSQIKKILTNNKN